MFPQSAPDHPCEQSTHPSSPAGLRIADYINPRRYFDLFRGPGFDMRSPDPSPLNSPTKDLRHLADVSLPSRHFPGHFSVNSHETLTGPSTPTSNDRRKGFSKAKNIDASTKDPLGRRLSRKARYGSMHLSFTKHNGSGIVPHHCRARHMQERRESVRKRMVNQHVQRAAWVRESLGQLRKEAEVLMTSENMNDQDRVFLEQLEKLEFQQEVTLDKMARAAAETGKRRKARKARNEGAAKTREERQADEDERMTDECLQAEAEEMAVRFRHMEEAALQADKERQHANETLEYRIKEEQERHFREERKQKEDERKRKEEEERKQEEEERQRKEEERKWNEEERKRKEERHKLEEGVRRWEEVWKQQREWRRLVDDADRRIHIIKELYAKGRRESQAREQREHQAREERERLAREERERQAREECEHHARFQAEQARLAADQIVQERKHLEIYEGKWDELRTSSTLPTINVWDIPWPVFGVVSCADQITDEDMRKFLFHPQRPGVEGKTPRDKIKMEVLRFHPDKFNMRVLPRIVPSQQAVAQAIAGAVARILTSIMAEDVEMQNQ